MKHVLVYVVALLAVFRLAFGDYAFPAPVDAQTDTANLNAMISAMSYSSTPEIVYFQAGIYQFILPPTSGQFNPFVETKNKIFLGANAGTQLKWLIPTTTGGVSARGDRITAHSFWWFQSSCENIEIYNLQFTTDLPDLDPTNPAFDTQGDGAHIKTDAKNMWIGYCMFSRAPSFCISINGDTTTVEYCYIFNTHADGIHEAGGIDTTIRQNLIDGTGDDGVGIYGTLGNLPFAVVVHDNIIRNTHSRGIAAGSSWFLDIRRNTIEWTALNGIEIKPENYEEPIDTSYPAYTPHSNRPYSVVLDQNIIRYAGFKLNPGGQISDTANGMLLANADYVTAGFNTIEHVKGAGIFCGNWLFSGHIGPAYLISDVGLGGVGSGLIIDTGFNVSTTIW
jgi:hypothetical protein